MNENKFSSVFDGKEVLIEFHDNELTFGTARPEDESVLFFYCSGGASLAGNYRKINKDLDQDQIDKTIYHDNLNPQGIGFNISTTKENGITELTVLPYGLSESNEPFKTNVEGKVTNSEIEDLNSDGFPEVLVYTESPDHFKDVIGYSVNNGKSMSRIRFPDIRENEKLTDIYKGYDEFSIVENFLGRRFPVLENCEKTEKIKQMFYEMVDGEISRTFKVKSISEY